MKKIYLTICFLLVYAGLILVQYQFDQNHKKIALPEPHVLKSDIVMAADMGLHNAAADVAWLSAIQYFGGGSSRTNEKLDDYLVLSIELDQKFAYPYAFGALALPAIGQVDQGIAISKLGVERKIPDYRIPYYLATTYHVNKEDKQNAALYFDIAANTPGSPAGIKKVAANYGSRPDLRSETRAIWQGIYETTKDEVVKEKSKSYLDHFDLLTALENLAKAYKTKNGKYPVDVDQFVAEKILPSVPEDPFGFEYKFNADTGRAEIK
ncbi:MAG: hypothetical protein WC227_01180 [Patescibacteria group bacterium]|jgi:hypothetical protein